MSPNPRLSVIIPCRNEATHLPRQLAALADQACASSWEVVVADNGSTDHTVAVARLATRALPALCIVDAAGAPGRQHACNIGAAAAAGELLVFLDGDDEVAPGFLDAMVRGLEEHPFVAARLDYEALNAPWVRGTRRGAQAEGLQDWHFLPMAAGCSLGIRRTAFEQIGGFDQGMHHAEDVDLWWRAHRAGFERAFVPDAVIRYRYRTDLRGIYRQARGYGRGEAVLNRLYRSPATTVPRKAVASTRLVYWLVRRIPRLRDRTMRGRSAWDIGYVTGWMQGSVRPWRYCQPTRHGPVARGRG